LTAILAQLAGVGHLCFKFRGQAGAGRALRDISLLLGDNECLWIVGESGSGKSTLTPIIVGLGSPTAGHVRHQDHIVSRAAQLALSDPEAREPVPPHRHGVPA